MKRWSVISAAICNVWFRLYRVCSELRLTSRWPTKLILGFYFELIWDKENQLSFNWEERWGHPVLQRKHAGSALSHHSPEDFSNNEVDITLSCEIARGLAGSLAGNRELVVLEMINIQLNDEKTLETTGQTSHPSSHLVYSHISSCLQTRPECFWWEHCLRWLPWKE